MSTKDPEGYYSILEVPATASAAEIKIAYRRKARVFHPDRNTSPNATKDFQILTEAYNILSDPLARAQYDTISVEAKSSNTTSSETPPELIMCSVCGKVTAQPRYAIFYEVKSFIFMTTRTPIQGIFCSSCAEKKALRATVVTWLLGWWGIPWGFIYSFQAICANLLGGERPHNINARLAAHQARIFAMLGKIDMARAIAIDALDLALKIKPDKASTKLMQAFGYENTHEDVWLIKEIEELLAALGKSGKAIRLKDSWALLRRPLYVQGLIALIAISLVWSALQSNKSNAPPLGPKPYIANPEHAPAPKPSYVSPTTAPNGEPWPIGANYVHGYHRTNADGLSTVTVDNSRNNADVFVKLVSLDGPQAFPVRIFFIPAHGRFTLSKVTAGSYDIRYRDLSSGQLSRTEAFNLEEISSYDSTQYSNITMTLYEVLHGNMHIYGLSETEF
ncbi:J domain-containing protein [Shewanella sp. AS16]|uniref:J domain-containing protein n=1 Tax=Shewanella sp. AS16 TaxID=2907625 RepID=UPI001F4730AA|nr:J domain-containing protein [Shewanella sp. AS16]MCE9685797.1 J domain-containing protein [Shewanella sp. AS16]